MKKLKDYSQKEIAAMNYSDELLPLLKKEYAEAMNAVTVPAEINEWARKMEFQQLNNNAYEKWCVKNEIVPDPTEKAEWCKTLGIWYQRLPLVTAFMVVRWGEDPEQWPDQFTSEDIHRAKTWFKKPRTVPGIQKAEEAGV